MTIREKIIKIFNQNAGIIRIKDITMHGINKYHLSKLVKAGEVEKIRYGVYKLIDKQANYYAEIKRIVPNGIICLFSAWNYYNLTTYIPHEFHIAIEQKSKIKLPDYPPIKIYYWSKDILELGIEKVKIDNTKIEIYDIEKSVCDAVKYRNKVGKDILNEILNEYLSRNERNIEKLITYSKILRIEQILKNYLDVLL